MTLEFSKDYTNTMNHLPDDSKHVWLFESIHSRRIKQQQLTKSGHDIQIFSAYKTLLCFFLESDMLSKSSKAIIHYPVIEQDEPLRFRLECYPLNAMFSNCQISYQAQPPSELETNQLPNYEVEYFIEDKKYRIAIPVPVRWRERHDGKKVLASCGWMIDDQNNGRHLATEFESMYLDICDYLWHCDLIPLNEDEPEGPFFDRLEFNIKLAFKDIPLPVGHEKISLAEAMHEEIYFTAIEYFQKRLSLPPLSRNLKSGQIIPNVSFAKHLQVSIHKNNNDCLYDEDMHGVINLEQCTHWLQPKQINALLASIDGDLFSVESRQGRQVFAKAFYATDKKNAGKLAISSAQHANETSGIIGALRAAQTLVRKNILDFTICPVENVDGYALYRALCRDCPQDMLHAARYTASGNDIAFGNELYEASFRKKAYQHVAAEVHINLHGYPAHEWTRPLSGYVPIGFAKWTIPKGFFLICRYRKDHHQPLAHTLLFQALEAIYQYLPIRLLNQQMLTKYTDAVGSLDFALYKNCIPYTIEQIDDNDDGIYNITIISEAADESIYGEDFIIAHETQYRVIMAIADYLGEPR